MYEESDADENAQEDADEEGEMLITALLLLLAMLVVGTFASGWNDANDQWSRVSWLMMGCGLLMAWASPNPYLGVLIGVFVVGVIFQSPMIERTMATVVPTLVLVATYLLIAPSMRAWMIVPLLYGMVGVGLLLTGLAWYAARQPAGLFRSILGNWYHFVERDAAYPLAMQGNWNHAQSIGALAVAANLGLVLLGHTLAVLLLPLTLGGVILCIPHDSFPKDGWTSQGAVHLTTAAVVFAGIVVGGWWAVVLLACYVGLLLSIGKPWNPRWEWLDNGRFWSWRLAIRDLWWNGYLPPDPVKAQEFEAQELVKGTEFGEALNQERVDIEAGTRALPPDVPSLEQYVALWHQAFQAWSLQMAIKTNAKRAWDVLVKAQTGATLTREERWIYWGLRWQTWRIRLLGFGTHQWYEKTKWPTLEKTGVVQPNGEKAGMVFISAHNEYVEWLFNHGLIGFAALLMFLTTTLWTLWTAGPLGQAVYLVAMTLCSVAMLNFPWTLFQEVPPDPRKPLQQYIGAPGMIVASLVIALMAAAV